MVCGERLFTGFAQSLCGECMKESPPFEKASAYGSYHGGIRELIHLLKYDLVLPAAKILGRMLAEAAIDLAQDFGAQLPVVVPVPLHGSKLQQRGFNQSERMARSMVSQKPMGMKLELVPEVLVRRRATDSQTGLTRQQRIANLRGAFSVACPDVIQGRNILLLVLLLVDDVFTTGTTVSECARILRRAGAEKIWVVTLARVLKSQTTFARAGEEEQEQGLVMAAGTC
jgi:ComF family protein